MQLVQALNQDSPAQVQIVEFKGYNNDSIIEDGEMRDMQNLSSDKYPNLYQRAPRCKFSEAYENATDMLARADDIAVIADGAFYYMGQPIFNLNDQYPKKMVAINTRICIWPDKVYYYTKGDHAGEYGPLDASTSVESVTVTTNSLTGSFSEGISELKVGDAVTISGFTENNTAGVSAVIQDITSGSITFPDETFDTYNYTGDAARDSYTESGPITVERTVPDLEHVVESNNRLFGCAENTIYASKLGDPTNWNYYQGLSTDSYALDVGTDGEFTGCIPYGTHVLFMKEDRIHKLYGTKPSAYQMMTTECHGLEAGSEKSMAIVNETLFYKSRLGIMAYGGSTPQLVSSVFGVTKYRNAVAGTDSMKYYVSLEDIATGKYDMFVMDVQKGMWHKEDNIHVRDWAYVGGATGQLVYIDDSDGMLYSVKCLADDQPLPDENKIPWFAELGDFEEHVSTGWYSSRRVENRKIYSKIKMRVNMEKDSELTVKVQFDGGEWETNYYMHADIQRTFELFIIPRRCDRFKIRLEGKGYTTIETLSRYYREGSAI